MENVAPILVALGGLLTALGAVAKWLWDKIESRFKVIETALEECRDHSAIKLTVIELMWQEIENLAPDSLVLRRVKRLLDGLKKAEREHG